MNHFPAKVTKTGLEYNPRMYHYFAEKHDGKWCDVVLREPKRSLSQNSYYWVFVTIIARETGNNEDELHEFFKQKFLPMKKIVLRGKDTTEHVFTRLTSTTELNKVDFGDYLTKISALTGVPLPDPKEAGYIPNK